MGGLISSKTPLSNCTSLVRSRKLTTPELWAIVEKGNRVDYYELLGFQRYTNPEAAAVIQAARLCSREFHPDKNPTADAARLKFLTAIFVTICDAKETFLDPKKKERYDYHLKMARGDMSNGEWLKCRGRLIGSILLSVVGAIGTFMNPGGVAVAAVAGFALSSGVKGTVSAWRDPEKPLSTFLKEGAACGALGAVWSATCFHFVKSAAFAPAAEFSGDIATAGTSSFLTRVGGKAVEAVCQAIAANFMIGFRFEDPLCVRWQRSTFYKDLLCEEDLGTEPLPMSGPMLEDLSWKYDRKTHEKVQRTASPDMIRELREYKEFNSCSCIKAYTVESCLFYHLNEYLCEESPDLVLYLRFLYNLRRELRNGNNFYKDSHPLWRAAEVKEDSIDAMTTVGTRFLIPSFVSTSKQRHIAEGLMVLGDVKNALIEFDCSKNMGEQGCTYVKDISDISRYREAEHLFYPYSGFEVTAAERTKVAGKQVWHIKLKTMDTIWVENHLRAAPREC